MAHDGQSALEIFRTRPQQFDLVLTNKDMPKMGGLELCHQLRQSRTDLPVILLTGSLNSVDNDSLNKLGILHYFIKPVNFKELEAYIQDVLISE
ncbi:response regulator [Deltaproteobacteria bacterium TL4]